MNRYREMTDEYLIRLYLDGDHQAFAALVDRHKNRIFTTIVLLVKDRRLAEDIFQEVFIKIINALHSGQYSENSRFLAWAARIAHNYCISHFRKTNTWSAVITGYRDEISESPDYLEHSAEQRMMTAEVNHEVGVMLDMLPPAQREALILRFYADLSYKEIAQVVNISINTALGRVRYALMNLRKMMEREKMLALTGMEMNG